MSAVELLHEAAAAVRAGVPLDGAREVLADWLDSTAVDLGIRAGIWTSTGQEVEPLAECLYAQPLAVARMVRQEAST